MTAIFGSRTSEVQCENNINYFPSNTFHVYMQYRCKQTLSCLNLPRASAAADMRWWVTSRLESLKTKIYAVQSSGTRRAFRDVNRETRDFIGGIISREQPIRWIVVVDDNGSRVNFVRERVRAIKQFQKQTSPGCIYIIDRNPSPRRWYRLASKT